MPPVNQPAQPAPGSPEPQAPKNKKYNVKLLKRDLNFSLIQLVLFILIFGGIGGYIILSSFAATPPSGSSAVSSSDDIPGQLLVRFKPNATKAQRDKVFKDNNLTEVSEIPQIGVKVVHVPTNAASGVKAALSHNPNIDFAEQDHILKPQDEIPNDPYYPSSGSALAGGNWGWTDKFSKTSEAWDISQGDPSTVIAILDTGIKTAGLSDFSGQITSTWNAMNNTTDATTNAGNHGTYVAGVAGLAINNGAGGAGYCPKCKLMIVQVGTDNGASDSTIAAGLTYAADHGAKIANMSWAGTSDDSTLSSATTYAHNHGVMIFAAAGNSNCDCKTYPAADPYVLGVGGYGGGTFNKSGDSNFGSWVAFAAPEGNLTAWPALNGSPGYAPVGGTSVASPAAAGMAGLVWSKNPAMSEAQVEQALKSTAATATFSVAYGNLMPLAALQSLGYNDPQTSSAPVQVTAPELYYESPQGNNNNIITLTEVPQVGQTLVRGIGGWTGSAPLAEKPTQWQRCNNSGAACTTLSSGATTYTVQAADVGSTIKLLVNVGNNIGTTSASVLSGVVGGGGTPVPTVSLSANPSSITAGQSSTLAWSSTNAASCSGSWTSSIATSGSQTVSPTANTTYSLTCTGAGGSATTSATVLVSPAATPPATPSGLAPTPGNGSVILTWSANTEADLAGYNLQWKPASGSTWTSVNNIAGLTYTVSGLTNGTSYDFQLQAVNTTGQTSSWTATVSAVAAAPPADTRAPTVNITAPANGSNIGNAKKITISANAADNNVVIKIELYIDGQLKTTVTTPSLSYTWSINKTVTSGSHTITVKAYDPAGNVGQSSVTITR